MLAKKEIQSVLTAYRAFLSGESDKHRFDIGAGAARLDAKHNMFRPGRKVETWKSPRTVARLQDLLEPRTYAEDEVVYGDSDEPTRVVVVRYNGRADQAEQVIPSETSYEGLYPVSAGDVVISNIAAT